jgi:hypothetical protein
MAYTYIDEAEAYQQYDDMLDEVFSNDLDIPSSDILKRCDPIRYECGFTDWLDGMELTTDEAETEDDGEGV